MKATKFNKTSIIRIGITILFLLTTSFCSQKNMVEKSESDTNLLFGLLAGQLTGQQQESGKDFILNGQWDSFTGNGTTKDTIQTINAKQGVKGVLLTDSSGFGGYSSCSIIYEFSNTNGIYIAQNPENNGGCFSGDTNKGKYFKTVFFKNTEKSNSYWTCTINFPGVATQSDATAIVDTTIKTNPGTTGCGSSSWSRIEKR